MINRLRKFKQYLKRTVLQCAYSVIGSDVKCNICKWKDKHFNSDNWHPHTICPNCHSQVRHRLFWAIVNNINEYHIQKIISGKKVLHFAPDPCLRNLIAKESRVCHTADLFAEGYSYEHIDYRIDISNMKEISNDEYDCFIAFDVLEHVPNHLKAIEEIYRVLRKGGICILTVPQKDNLIKTYEDPQIVDPTERENKFGQHDHLRIYGKDFVDILARKGFRVEVLDEKCLHQTIVKKNVLFPPLLSQHPFATNYRKIYFGKKE